MKKSEMPKISVFQGKDNVEVFLTLGRTKGVYLTLDRWDKRSFLIEVRKAKNGCPGGIKADFSKVYKETRSV